MTENEHSDKNDEKLTAEAVENTRRYFLAMCDEPDGPDTVMIGRVCDAALRSLDLESFGDGNGKSNAEGPTATVVPVSNVAGETNNVLYTPDQQRAANYILEASGGNLGGGDDPVGFLIVSHRTLSARAPTVDGDEIFRAVAEKFREYPLAVQAVDECKARMVEAGLAHTPPEGAEPK